MASSIAQARYSGDGTRFGRLRHCRARGPERESWEKRRGGTDFKALMVAEPKAVDTLDMAHAAPFHAKEPEDVFYDIAPLKYKGWSEFAEAPRNCCRSGSR